MTATETALLAAGLVVYNAGANLWPPFHTWAYVPVNLAVGAGVIGIGATAGLTAAAMGLTPGGAPADLLRGVVLGALIAAPLFVLAARRGTARVVADRRAADAAGDPRALLYRTLVRIPFGTALFEEVAFRGVLLGALLSFGRPEAVLWSSVAFGLWHAVPARHLVRVNRPDAAPRTIVLVVAGNVAATAVAGAGLAWLRILSGGIWLPAGLHGALNSVATAAAVRAHRTAQRL